MNIIEIIIAVAVIAFYAAVTFALITAIVEAVVVYRNGGGRK